MSKVSSTQRPSGARRRRRRLAGGPALTQCSVKVECNQPWHCHAAPSALDRPCGENRSATGPAEHTAAAGLLLIYAAETQMSRKSQVAHDRPAALPPPRCAVLLRWEPASNLGPAILPYTRIPVIKSPATVEQSGTRGHWLSQTWLPIVAAAEGQVGGGLRSLARQLGAFTVFRLSHPHPIIIMDDTHKQQPSHPCAYPSPSTVAFVCTPPRKPPPLHRLDSPAASMHASFAAIKLIYEAAAPFEQCYWQCRSSRVCARTAAPRQRGCGGRWPGPLRSSVLWISSGVAQ